MSKLRPLIIFLLVLAITVPVMAQDNSSEQTGQTTPSITAALPQLLDEGDKASNAGSYAQAAVDYSLFILLNPTLPQGYVSRALNYQAMGDTDHAIQDLSLALGYHPTPPQYTSALYYTRATLYLSKNDDTSALTDLDASLDAYPQDVNSLKLRAQVLTFQQKYNAALDDYNQLIALEPSDSNHYLDRGFIQSQLGDSQAALDDYTQAIQLSPKDSSPYAQRALYYTTVRNFNQALDDINNAIDLSPDNSRLYLVRGSINAVVNKPVDAADDYFRFITLNKTRQFVAPSTLTTNQNFTVTMGPGYVYNVPFQADAGQTINVGAQALSQQAPVDPLLVILGIQGNPLVADDDSGGDLNAAIQNFTIPEPGEYTLIISQAAGGAQQGDVLVRLDLGK